MKSIYIGETPLEAHIVKDLIESAGIAAVIRGENLFGVRGGLPISAETAPSVWVAEADYERAQALVDEMLRTESRAPEGTSWRCPQCGEYLDPQFTACWQCGAPRPDNA